MSLTPRLRKTLVHTLQHSARPAIFAVAPPRSTLYQPLLTNPTATRAFTNTTGNMAKQGVHNLKSKAEFDDALGQDGLMVIDCFATWCGPCKMIAPKVVEFSDVYPNARFYKLDVDELPEVAQELSVRMMPTFMFFKGGEKVSEVVGANPAALEAAIKSNV